MERIVCTSNNGKHPDSECRDGEHRNSVTPFKFPDESPTWNEWRLYHSQEDQHQDYPLGIKECWSFGKAIFKRYYRHDWTESSVHRLSGSWTRDSVEAAASRFLGINQISCAYSIRVRGVNVSVSGGSGTLQRIIEMALRCKQEQLLSTQISIGSRIPTQEHVNDPEEREQETLIRDFGEGMKLRSGKVINSN